MIHADETHVNLQKGKGYVWVLANLEDVVYMYRPNREAAFLQDLLKDFKGVLVSDFYSGYDSLPCEQQKCLVHLIRDINDDLMGNPYDEEFKALAAEFGKLLRSIVDTIDKYGLKKRHLHKHKAEVARFFRDLEARVYRSELAEGYQKRLAKNEGKLFTFLDHDGVPWNNNPAEHAVKAFAYYRRVTDGMLEEGGLSDYLVLLSVHQTCKYRGVSFLKFLLSRERMSKPTASGSRRRLADSPWRSTHLDSPVCTPTKRSRRANPPRQAHSHNGENPNSGDTIPVRRDKVLDLQWVQIPPGIWIAPAGSYRSDAWR